MSYEVLFSPEELRARVAQLGAQLAGEFTGRNPLIIGVLKGSVIFLADLVRAMAIPLEVDFMSVSSYGEGSPSGVVRILKDLDVALKGREVLLVEDVVDTGLKLTYLLANLRDRQPRSLSVCALVDKPQRRLIEVDVDYKGFAVDRFVVGYGLDFRGRYRGLPAVLAVDDLADLTSNPALLEGLAEELQEDAIRDQEVGKN